MKRVERSERLTVLLISDISHPHPHHLDLYGQTMRVHYRGVTLAIVTTGPTGADLYLHWTFTGRAISNPGSGGTVVPPQR